MGDCLAFAQTNNLQVQQAGLLQDKSIVQLNTANKSFLPTVNARMRTTGNWGFLIDPSTNELSDQFNFGNQAALNMNWNLFNGFATSHQIKLRTQQVAAATYDYQVSSNSTSLNIIYAFLQVLLGQEQLKNSKQRAAYLVEQQRKVKNQVDKGVLSKRDWLNLQSQVAAEELQTVYAENGVDKAILNLKQVVGLPLAEDLTVQTGKISDDWLPTELISAEVVTAAATALPDLKAAQARVEATQHAWQLERASYKPTFALTAQLATRTSNYKTEVFTNQVLDNLNRRVGLSLYVPIANGFLLRNTDQLAKLNAESAKLNYQQVERDLSGKVMSALLDYKAAAKKYRVLQLQYSLLSEEHRYAAKMLELGGLNAMEYSVTRSRLVTAQSELIQAKYDCFFKQKTLDFYQGKPLPSVL
ncbi:TolC family protein [Hymenobacter volaticus]|uniref:TolC family protein n=1 Tax=Hymenobacter volaticus TaxID=2932254 RepID=A0ABY4GCF6_9BACT|nr:TolC family protein [Hymenobacter volaticus]UOQ68586.1 TolC family protein [Hymenobacter volaticus]